MNWNKHYNTATQPHEARHNITQEGKITGKNTLSCPQIILNNNNNQLHVMVCLSKEFEWPGMLHSNTVLEKMLQSSMNLKFVRKKNV